MTLPAPTQAIDQRIRYLAEEQVLFLKHNYNMQPREIITLYGGNAHGHETYRDAVERIAVFNLQSATKNGFVA